MATSQGTRSSDKLARGLTVANVERAADGSFPDTSMGDWARHLRIPYSRVYNAACELGIREIRTDDDIRRIAQYLQRQAISFTALADLFGPDVTLLALKRGEVLP